MKKKKQFSTLQKSSFTNGTKWYVCNILGSIFDQYMNLFNLQRTILILTASATGLGASSDVSCGTGTAVASEHSAMAIKAKHFHDMACILVSICYNQISVRRREKK